ncbi:PREDICTED: DCN1-like protein 4 isoform X1 [Theobroma cacao]|uniref:Defective in cullin neddylation protein n=2 Tax=Theobroma cacao TaxID=3641 RepID=A0AB32UNV6_THECC|nr:PREDICTED: DCN1-like protein 4 isoform X1 [Theobroma cacao]
MPPRAPKRKSAPPNSLSVTSSDGSSVSSKAKTKGFVRIDRMFDSYANSSLGMIDPDGIEALCSDLGVDCTDVRILMLAWKLKAQRQGYFTQDEWRTGLKELRVDSISKLKKALPELEKEVGKPSNYDSFYSYAFRYCLTEEMQKSVDIESICELLNLVLGAQFRPQVDLLIEYLKVQSDYKVINLDQWINFLRFCQEINFPDLENYDATQAWPLILDNFVDWMREKHSSF